LPKENILSDQEIAIVYIAIERKEVYRREQSITLIGCDK